MTIALGLVNHDEEFNTLLHKPIIANYQDITTPEGLSKFKSRLFSHYKNSDSIEESASCVCGAITDVQHIGAICPECNTEVVSSNERPIVPSVWIKAPEGVASLISPQLLILLNDVKVSGFDPIAYFLNTRQRFQIDKITKKIPRMKIDKLLSFGFKRGLNSFITNFDEIIEALIISKFIPRTKVDYIDLLLKNKTYWFPQHLPIPSRVCVVAESTTSGIYIDRPLLGVVDAAMTMASLNNSGLRVRSIDIQNKVSSALLALAEFHLTYSRKRIASKPGIMRKHVFSGSLHFTGRAVITSISRPHAYDEVELPWGLGLQLLKYHIIGFLFRKGFSFTEAMYLLYGNVLKDNPDPLLVDIVEEIVNTGNLKCTVARNPTLQRGSIQYFTISKVKTNSRDNSLGLSTMVLKSPNADFDGDELNICLMLDEQSKQAFSRLSPHLWVWSLDNPHELSSNLVPQGPVLETMANWLLRNRAKAKG